MAVGNGRHTTIYARLAGSGDTGWIQESHGATTQPRGLGYVQHVCAFLANTIGRVTWAGAAYVPWSILRDL